jgi:hypothetical protein
MAGRQSAASDGLELILNVRRADAGLESFERHTGRLWSLFLRSHHHTSSSRLLWKVFGIPLPLAHCALSESLGFGISTLTSHGKEVLKMH